ncbi:MAG: hypothetical protein IJZ39_07080 [Oscillospiraceae bacterium]|nr:hypothetical protein [Oscillospiraceae bacterium]
MDILEFVEKVIGVELNEWQKKILKELASLPPDRRVLILPPSRRSYYNGIIALWRAMFEGGPNATGNSQT